MKFLYTIFILMLLVACQSSQTNTKEVSDSDSTKTALSFEEVPNVEGYWEFVKNEILVPAPDIEDPRDYMTEELIPDYEPYTAEVIFSKDSFYRAYYPKELLEGGTYKTDKGLLDVEGSLGLSRCIVEGDTMILYRMDYGNLVKETFCRGFFDDKVVSILKRDTVNYALLAGKWYLARRANINDDGTEYHLNFPHKVADSIFVTYNEITATVTTDRSIYMNTDGVKRKYYYGYRTGYVGELVLTPGDWYQGEDVMLEYWRMD